MQPCVGFRHFKAGISSLKQVTGRDHRNVQRYIVSIITDTVPKEFTLCIRALADFHYLAQSHTIDSRTLSKISHALDLFHENKQAILDIGARVGKGSKSLDNFFIPKLEFLHSVIPSICWSGAPIQWSADPTERAHIDVVKIPAENTNNGQYGPQICCHLNRDERRRLFDLATAIREAGNDLGSIVYNLAGGDNRDLDEELSTDWVSELDTATRVCRPSQKRVDLFADAYALATHSASDGMTGALSLAPRSFSTSWATFNLNQKPDIPDISIDSLAEMYGLLDLCPALLNLFSERFGNPSVHHIGGRRRTHADAQLPFTNVMVWFSFCMQTRSMDNGLVTDPRRLTAMLPSNEWPLGCYDTALLVEDSSTLTASLDIGLEGMFFRLSLSLHLLIISRVYRCTDPADLPPDLGLRGPPHPRLPALRPTVRYCPSANHHSSHSCRHPRSYHRAIHHEACTPHRQVTYW